MPDNGKRVSEITTLVLPKSMRDEIMVHLLQSAPNEGVGLLGVHPPQMVGDEQVAIAAQFVPGTNTDQSPTHFTMDPQEIIGAFRQFRKQNLMLGAIVHSHLRGPATPSESDVLEWNYPEALMLIASFAEQPPRLRAWRVVERDELAIVQAVGLRIDAG